MLRDIIKKEIQDTIMSPRFVFTFLLCTILILLAVYTGINNYQAELKEHSAAVALNKKNLESQQGYGQLAGLGTKINRKPQVLSTIVSGIWEAVGRVASVNIAYDPNMTESKYSSNPIFAVFGPLDLSFIVKIVLSLFAILFTYDAIVGEKEKGTLKLALSNKVPRDRLILGKAIGGFMWEENIRKWAEDLQQSLTGKIDERNAVIERDYQAKMNQQQKLAVNFSRISPTSAMMFGSMSLARTGVNEHDRFLSSVRTYKPIFTKWINEKMMQGNIFGGEQIKPDLSDMPQHEFIPEGLGDSFKRVLPDIILMVFLIIFFFVGAFVSFLRYDVR